MSRRLSYRQPSSQRHELLREGCEYAHVSRLMFTSNCVFASAKATSVSDVGVLAGVYQDSRSPLSASCNRLEVRGGGVRGGNGAGCSVAGGSNGKPSGIGNKLGSGIPNMVSSRSCIRRRQGSCKIGVGSACYWEISESKVRWIRCKIHARAEETFSLSLLGLTIAQESCFRFHLTHLAMIRGTKEAHRHIFGDADTMWKQQS